MGLGRKKEKKKKEVRGYAPPKELSTLSAILLMLMGLFMVLYFLVNVSMGVFGKTAVGAPYTRLVDGAVEADDLSMLSSTLFYTFEDESGALWEGNMSLLGNSEPIGDTVEVYYFPGYPQWSLLANRAEMKVAHFGCLALGMILLASGEKLIKEKKYKKAAAMAAASDTAAHQEEAVSPHDDGQQP